MSKTISKNLLVLVCFLGLLGCGVKGDPLPPEKAPRLGRGHPTYTKASEYISPDYKNKLDDEESPKKGDE